MLPTEKIIHFLQQKVEVTTEEAAVFGEAFQAKILRKKQLVIQPMFTAKYRYYVVKGALRSFIMDHKGEENTIALAIEDWWITDYNSYIYQKPATLFVAALEDSVVMQIDFATEQKLKATHPKFETFFRIIAERGLAFYQRRLISNLTQTAEERYHEFEERYPLINQRVPQYALASFLGMSTEYLSKLRNNRVKKK